LPAANRACRSQSAFNRYCMSPKKPAPDLIRGGDRFSEKIMLHQ
jgi:hypothetical protein